MNMTGFKAHFIIDLQPRHKCTICTLAMRSPVQTECGHLFCKNCLEPVLQESNPRCPVDQERISRDDTFPDNACKREILTLQVRCNNYISNCPWIGMLKKLESHLEICTYRQVECTQCGISVLYIHYTLHLSTECPKRLEECAKCMNKIPHDQMQLHIERLCPASSHKCPNGCNPSKDFSLKELNNHLELKGGDCPLQEIQCPYYQLGCSIKPKPRKDMSEHLHEHQVYHAQLSVEAIVESKSAVATVHKQLDKLQTQLDQQLQSKLTSLSENLGSKIDTKFDFLENKRDSLLEKLECNLKEKILNLQVEHERQQKSTQNILSTLQRSTPFSSHLDTTAAAMSSTLSQRVDHLYAKVTELDHTMNSCLNHNIDCDVRIQLLERATHDGTFLWKIDNFTQRRREAINGTTLSLYSSPFYTSKQGYKMCARVYLNGDGSGKSSHLSFFFCVMRGQNDALLPWPFKQKVTLVLINQNGRKNIIDQFRPDTQSSSFQRPIHREMNIASGCPTFCPLSELHNGFVKEDCIFLGVIVDTIGIPIPVTI